jgi:hypothetical protein
MKMWWTALIVVAIAVTSCAKIRVAPVTDVVRPLRTELAATQAGSAADRFGRLFCGTLAHNPDGGSWGPCADYFSSFGGPQPVSPQFTSTFRVLVIPGIFGECVESYAVPFDDGRRHLLAAHGIDVEYVSVSALGSTEFNANQIKEYLDDQFAGPNQTPYIVFGYSKGASDILEALVLFPHLRPRVAAVVSIAGSVLGSRLTQGTPGNMLDPIQALSLGPCGLADKGGLDSLRRAARVDSVAKLPPTVRSYSVAAVSTAATTSAVLMRSWKKLSAFSLEQDSQMIHEDAVVPGSQYLGVAKADHWAVALPFEHVAAFHPNTPPRVVRLLGRLVNHNHYPRAALFEAVLRYVLDDLASPYPD